MCWTWCQLPTWVSHSVQITQIKEIGWEGDQFGLLWYPHFVAFTQNYLLRILLIGYCRFTVFTHLLSVVNLKKINLCNFIRFRFVVLSHICVLYHSQTVRGKIIQLVKYLSNMIMAVSLVQRRTPEVLGNSSNYSLIKFRVYIGTLF